MTAISPALRSALATVLPDESETRLLRACLLDGESGRRAWEAFTTHHRSPRRALSSAAGERRTRLLPLLFANLRQNGVVLDDSWRTLLRAASLRESLRAQAYHDILHHVSATLTEAGVDCMAVRGAALGLTVYPHAAIRHSREIELLVRRDQHDAAVSSLLNQGHVTRRWANDRGAPETVFQHESGLGLRLSTQLYRDSFYRFSPEAIWRRARCLADAENGLCVPSLPDALVHACTDVFCRSGSASLVRVSDVDRIARTLDDNHWDEVGRFARSSRVELPLITALGYAARELGSPVPTGVLHLLSERPSAGPNVHRDFALFAARRGSGGARRMLRRVPRWQDRAVVISWLLVPSRPYVRRVSNPSELGSPFDYLSRLARATWDVGTSRRGREGRLTRAESDQGRDRRRSNVAQPNEP